MSLLSDGMWSGQSCLIVGGGPSLRGVDMDMWGRVGCFDGAVVATNRAAERTTADVWLAVDAAFWRGEWTPVENSPRVWVDTGDKHPGPGKVDEVVPCATPPGTPNRHNVLTWGRSLSEGVAAQNSGLAALNLADVLGADTIYLLGFDLRGEDGKTANWHSGYSHTKPASDQVYGRFLEGFRWAAGKVKARVVVLETYPGASRLGCWEKRRTEDVL